MFAPPCYILYISTTLRKNYCVFFFFFFFFYQKLKDLKHIVIRDIMENTSALSTRIFHNFSNDDMKKIMFQMSRMYTRVLKNFSRQFLVTSFRKNGGYSGFPIKVSDKAQKYIGFSLVLTLVTEYSFKINICTYLCL